MEGFPYEVQLMNETVQFPMDVTFHETMRRGVRGVCWCISVNKLKSECRGRLMYSLDIQMEEFVLGVVCKETSE